MLLFSSLKSLSNLPTRSHAPSTYSTNFHLLKIIAWKVPELLGYFKCQLYGRRVAVKPKPYHPTTRSFLESWTRFSKVAKIPAYLAEIVALSPDVVFFTKIIVEIGSSNYLGFIWSPELA